jgi:hypothetical protein
MITPTTGKEMVRRPSWVGGLMLALCLAQFGCLAHRRASPGEGPAGPAVGTDAAAVFTSLKEARLEAGKAQPTWVNLLEPVARQGANRLAAGGESASVAHDIASEAVYRFGRNISVWSFRSDGLALKPWPTRMLASYGLSVAIGVALMQTTSPGRYAIVVVIPEAGR